MATHKIKVRGEYSDIHPFTGSIVEIFKLDNKTFYVVKLCQPLEYANVSMTEITVESSSVEIIS